VVGSFVDADGVTFDCVAAKPHAPGSRGVPSPPPFAGIPGLAAPAAPAAPGRGVRSVDRGACPPGASAVVRITLEELVRAGSVGGFFSKDPGGEAGTPIGLGPG
jgi:hypothetical protein